MSETATKPKAEKKVSKKTATKPKAEIAVIEKKELSRNIENPLQVMEFGKVLQKYIADNHLSVEIQGRPYAQVGGWQFAGSAFGLTAIPRKPVRLHETGQYITILSVMKEFKSKDGSKTWTKESPIFIGFATDTETIEKVKAQHKISNEITKPYFAYECECDIKRLSDGSTVGYGLGFCSNLESLKSGFDEYSVSSMCQTRSIGKSYRNLLGFIMNSAGFESTPAEEMEQVNENAKEEKKSNKKPGTELKPPSQNQWTGIKTKFQKNEVTIETIKASFTISPELESELIALPKVMPTVDDTQFSQFMKQMISGKITLQEIESANQLSETQHNALKVVENSKPKKK